METMRRSASTTAPNIYLFKEPINCSLSCRLLGQLTKPHKITTLRNQIPGNMGKPSETAENNKIGEQRGEEKITPTTTDKCLGK